MHGQKYTDIIFSPNNFSQHREFIFSEVSKYNLFSPVIYTYNNTLNPTYDNLTQVPPRLVEREILENQTNVATAASIEAMSGFILVIESILKAKKIDIERVPMQEIVSKFDIKSNLDIPQTIDFAVAIYPPAKNSRVIIIQTSSITFQNELSRIIEDTKYSSENYDYVILLSTNQTKDFMEILQKRPSTSLRKAVFDFLEILDVLKNKPKNFVPPYRFLLNVEVPVSEALVSDLIDGIKCYHTDAKLDMTAFRSISNEYIDSKTVSKVINQEFQNQKLSSSQKESLQSEISVLTRELNDLTVGIDTSIAKKKTISKMLASLANASPTIAAIALGYTPFAPFSHLVAQGFEKIVQAKLGSSEVQITAISPVRGRAGELISIHGSNFGDEKNLVWFTKIPSQESDLEIPTPVQTLEIEVWTDKRIDVRVPKDCIPGEYLIRVTRVNILSNTIRFTLFEQEV